MDAVEFLEIVAGERCPCGHLAKVHRPASGAVPGETMGTCLKCECRGVIDAREDSE